MENINIHFVLNETARQYCQEININLREITPSAIIFDENSPMRPHISLIRGVVESSSTLEEIAEMAKQIVLKYEPIKLYVHPPYLENNNNSYILSDVYGGEQAKHLQEDLYSQLSANFAEIKTKQADIIHITLGAVSEKEEQVRAYLQEVKADFSFLTPALEISNEGEKGTCINSLYQFTFKNQ